MFATYITAHGNAGSLTPWAGPGVKPASSRILIGFAMVEPQWEPHYFIMPVLKGAIWPGQSKETVLCWDADGKTNSSRFTESMSPSKWVPFLKPFGGPASLLVAHRTPDPHILQPGFSDICKGSAFLWFWWRPGWRPLSHKRNNQSLTVVRITEVLWCHMAALPRPCLVASGVFTSLSSSLLVSKMRKSISDYQTSQPRVGSTFYFRTQYKFNLYILM